MKFILNYIKVKILGIINEYALFYSYTINYVFLESFRLTFPIVILLSFFYSNYKILIIVCLLKFKDELFKTPVWVSFYDRLMLDQETISNHWKNDKDLVLLNKVSLFFILIGGILCVTTLFLFLNKVSVPLSILLFFKTFNGFYIIFLGLILKFIGETHIIFFRNFPISDKVISQCINCGKIVLAGVGADSLMKIGFSFAPSNFEPTTIGNEFQTRVGRGFGFKTIRDGSHYDSFKKLENVQIKDFVDGKNMYDFNKANRFGQSPVNEKWGNANLPIEDRINLGIFKFE